MSDAVGVHRGGSDGVGHQGQQTFEGPHGEEGAHRGQGPLEHWRRMDRGGEHVGWHWITGVALEKHT